MHFLLRITAQRTQCIIYEQQDSNCSIYCFCCKHCKNSVSGETKLCLSISRYKSINIRQVFFFFLHKIVSVQLLHCSKCNVTKLSIIFLRLLIIHHCKKLLHQVFSGKVLTSLDHFCEKLLPILKFLPWCIQQRITQSIYSYKYIQKNKIDTNKLVACVYHS